MDLNKNINRSDYNDDIQGIIEEIESIKQGFQTHSFELKELDSTDRAITSMLSNQKALEFAQLVHLDAGEGVILYYPKKVDFDIGDVLYLRERDSGENGIIVQVIEKSTASYPQHDSKALFRLMTSVRAEQIQRSHHEPPEIIDEFLSLRFKVRAAIIDGNWSPHEGRVVTRNVDIFLISPDILLKNVVVQEENLNLFLGDYKGENLYVYGGGFEKVNLITGMKGGGKSHITKGIIHEKQRLNMSSVVFDINNEYGKVTSDTLILKPGVNLKFRLDYMEPRTLFRIIDKLAPLPEKTAYSAYAKIPKELIARKKNDHIPDIGFLKSIVERIVRGSNNNESVKNMRSAYIRTLEIIESYQLIMTEEEAKEEEKAIRSRKPPLVMSLRSAFHNMMNGKPQVLIFQIGGLQLDLQSVIVSLVLDHLKKTCDIQNDNYLKGNSSYPIYPTVFFEEAHMYMDEKDINDLIPIIRHIGINVFFVTNTPGALPDSVFRLLDNLIMTRMVNMKDINRLVDCGLTDKETIIGFAQNLKDHHTLFLSAKNGATKNFPLVFHVRDFGLPISGETRSQWEAMKKSRL